jgi:hypothetical protein
MLLLKFSIMLLFRIVLNLDMTQMVLMLEAQMNFVSMLLMTRAHKEMLFVMTRRCSFGCFIYKIL